MRTYYDAIYLSPHLDDAALSCGGQIHQQTAAGRSVLIVTVMAGDPPTQAVSDYARSLQERWQLLVDAAEGRRAEDLAACRILGADAAHWGVPDCIYRHDPVTDAPYYVSDDDIFGDVHPDEAALVAELAPRLAGLPRHGRLYVPLTVGHHVDHQLVRAAAEAAYVPASLWYYEDYPYASEPGALAAVIGDEAWKWEDEAIALADADLAAKVAAIAAFQSQLSTFWQDEDELARAVRQHATSGGGERIWRRGR